MEYEELSFFELSELYIKHLINSNRRASTITLTRRTHLKLIKYLASYIPAELTPKIISDWLGSLYATLSPQTVYSERGRACSWFNWLSREEYIPLYEWSRRVVRVQVDEKAPKCLTPEQAKRFIVAVQTMIHRDELVKRRDIAMVYMLIDTAMRKGELLRLKLSDVDLHTGAVRISEECKGRKERTVWVDELVISAIRSYLRVRRKYSGDNLWVTKNGTVPNDSNVLTEIKKCGRAAGLDMTVHELRHTAITQLIRDGMSESTAGKIAGHANPATTRKYTHLANDDIRNEAMAHSPMKAFV